MPDGTIIRGPLPYGKALECAQRREGKGCQSHGGKVGAGLSSYLCPSTRGASKPLFLRSLLGLHLSNEGSTRRNYTRGVGLGEATSMAETWQRLSRDVGGWLPSTPDPMRVLSNGPPQSGLAKVMQLLTHLMDGDTEA